MKNVSGYVAIEKVAETEDGLSRCYYKFMLLENVIRLVKFACQSRKTKRHKFRDYKVWDYHRHDTHEERPWVPSYLVGEVLGEFRGQIKWEEDLK